jgi:hypothetical protein
MIRSIQAPLHKRELVDGEGRFYYNRLVGVPQYVREVARWTTGRQRV